MKTQILNYVFMKKQVDRKTGLTILSTLFWSKIEDKNNLSINISLWYKYLMFEKYDIFIQANPFKGKSFNTPIDI